MGVSPEMSANKILIADDDRVVHESLSIYLKAEGYEVVDAYNGAEAIEKLDAEIALCVLDIMMPVMSGKPARRFAKTPAYQSLC